MVEWLIEIFRSSYSTLYVGAFVVAAFLLVSGLDDVFVDMYYWFHHFFSRKKLEQYRNASPEKLHNIPEKPIAIFVPAWHEYDVIDKMLLNACRTIQYKSYDIFVGVYPNDPQTVEKVQEVSKHFPNVHAVVSEKPGPTTKADNLNQVHLGMLRWENKTGIRYDIILMHDSEDVIHPMSLKINNYFIPEYDMVQMPVFPLHTSHVSIVHWTYADEFAENHTKDIIARAHFSGFVPSAGVGTGFNRWIIEFVGTSFARNIFRSASLTEDYDLALRLALGKANLLFVYRPFGINASTRGFFPHSMRAAIRQRSRWIMGICLQSWKTIGWKGDARFRFVLYRDRKAIIANAINFGAYVVVTYLMAYEAVRFGFTAYRELPPIVVKGTVLWYLVVIDTVLMLWRIFHRFVSVRRVYGLWAATLSVVRLPISNIVNFSATGRALYQFFKATMKKKELKWEKTKHEFPSAAQHPSG
jgi:adsorption protein B